MSNLMCFNFFRTFLYKCFFYILKNLFNYPWDTPNSCFFAKSPYLSVKISMSGILFPQSISDSGPFPKGLKLGKMGSSERCFY